MLTSRPVWEMENVLPATVMDVVRVVTPPSTEPCWAGYATSASPAV
ncbi:MAG: hypothetical protein PHG71_04020 [Kiritimatiellae bacterium]|nr:hypothetical protein [Kiritimatiellia bacterium]MDD4622385.1 hypothetical protein [Kiritimatiellia bacterium]